MKIKIIPDLETFSGTILIPMFENEEVDRTIIISENTSVPSTLFSGKKDSTYAFQDKNNLCLAIGLGKQADYKTIKTIFRRVAAKQQDLLNEGVAILISENFSATQVEAIISGLLLGTYNLGHYKKEQKNHAFLNPNFILNIVTTSNFKSAAERGIKIAHAQLANFYLVDLPPNTVTPKYLANWAVEKGKQYGFDVVVLGHEDAKIAGLGAFLAVGKGSEQEPQFVIMKYVPKNAVQPLKHVGLVGKGITFDTGGLNIKTAGMLHMKCDMAGGAAVFGAMQLIADLQLPIQVTAIVPCAENAVDAKSFLPSDVIKSYSGHSIEIIDTDAEGRLILADALSYMIKNFNPEYLIDIATLTGSSVSTFGYECGALFTNNSKIAEQLQVNGEVIGERLWQLPLWDCYKSDIQSDIADVKNYSGKAVAGAISAAKFLEYFTNEHPAWAHLDIAGVAFGDDEFAKSKHATGYGVHLLTSFVENI
jgi:leucyl aminopeptidase